MSDYRHEYCRAVEQRDKLREVLSEIRGMGNAMLDAEYNLLIDKLTKLARAALEESE